MFFSRRIVPNNLMNAFCAASASDRVRAEQRHLVPQICRYSVW